MTRSLGTASSNPRLGTPEHGEPQLPHGHEAGDGEAAPSDYGHLQRLDYWAALNALRDEKTRLEADTK